jgi:hypothetical protein
MMVLGIIIAIVGAFLVFRFVVGAIKFGLLAVILIVALWLASGGLHGAPLLGGAR